MTRDDSITAIWKYEVNLVQWRIQTHLTYEVCKYVEGFPTQILHISPRPSLSLYGNQWGTKEV